MSNILTFSKKKVEMQKQVSLIGKEEGAKLWLDVEVFQADHTHNAAFSSASSIRGVASWKGEHWGLCGSNGKLIPEGRICWSEAPLEVVIQKPYAIAFLSRFVEIRSLRQPYPLIQTIVLRNVRHLCQSSKSMILALDNSIQGLFPVPLGAQIVQLTASGNFEEALSLCKLRPPEESSIRAAKEGSFHIRYAHYIFENGSYEGYGPFSGISSGYNLSDMVNSYLKQHSPNMQAWYLELMLAMNENAISGNLQNEMVNIYLSEVLDWHADLNAQQNWEQKTFTPTRKNLLSALEGISGYNPEVLLKRLPEDALYEERALSLGK
ncbi:unnamed protein product [Trifolium pratense]|uniref:Uncharacterized protein n=1 Tax=Trifolium pratense TaxID=57577 RepID=A0ACB0JR41_TRIPR|nr:unnamed protein product [Trifolium pratense]